MINPSTIDPLILPSVALPDRKQLPALPGVYFAVCGERVVRYIGLTMSLQRRWRYHNRLVDLQGFDPVRIFYAEVSIGFPLYEAKRIERELIRRFEPCLNTFENVNGERYKALFSKEAIAERSAKSIESNRITSLRKAKGKSLAQSIAD